MSASRLERQRQAELRESLKDLARLTLSSHCNLPNVRLDTPQNVDGSASWGQSFINSNPFPDTNEKEVDRNCVSICDKLRLHAQGEKAEFLEKRVVEFKKRWEWEKEREWERWEKEKEKEKERARAARERAESADVEMERRESDGGGGISSERKGRKSNGSVNGIDGLDGLDEETISAVIRNTASPLRRKSLPAPSNNATVKKKKFDRLKFRSLDLCSAHTILRLLMELSFEPLSVPTRILQAFQKVRERKFQQKIEGVRRWELSVQRPLRPAEERIGELAEKNLEAWQGEWMGGGKKEEKTGSGTNNATSKESKKPKRRSIRFEDEVQHEDEVKAKQKTSESDAKNADVDMSDVKDTKEDVDEVDWWDEKDERNSDSPTAHLERLHFLENSFTARNKLNPFAPVSSRHQPQTVNQPEEEPIGVRLSPDGRANSSNANSADSNNQSAAVTYRQQLLDIEARASKHNFVQNLIGIAVGESGGGGDSTNVPMESANGNFSLQESRVPTDAAAEAAMNSRIRDEIIATLTGFATDLFPVKLGENRANTAGKRLCKVVDLEGIGVANAGLPVSVPMKKCLSQIAKWSTALDELRTFTVFIHALWGVDPRIDAGVGLNNNKYIHDVASEADRDAMSSIAKRLASAKKLDLETLHLTTVLLDRERAKEAEKKKQERVESLMRGESDRVVNEMMANRGLEGCEQYFELRRREADRKAKSGKNISSIFGDAWLVLSRYLAKLIQHWDASISNYLQHSPGFLHGDFLSSEHDQNKSDSAKSQDQQNYSQSHLQNSLEQCTILRLFLQYLTPKIPEMLEIRDVVQDALSAVNQLESLDALLTSVFDQTSKLQASTDAALLQTVTKRAIADAHPISNRSNCHSNGSQFSSNSGSASATLSLAQLLMASNVKKLERWNLFGVGESINPDTCFPFPSRVARAGEIARLEAAVSERGRSSGGGIEENMMLSCQTDTDVGLVDFTFSMQENEVGEKIQNEFNQLQPPKSSTGGSKIIDRLQLLMDGSRNTTSGSSNDNSTVVEIDFNLLPKSVHSTVTLAGTETADQASTNTSTNITAAEISTARSLLNQSSPVVQLNRTIFEKITPTMGTLMERSSHRVLEYLLEPPFGALRLMLVGLRSIALGHNQGIMDRICEVLVGRETNLEKDKRLLKKRRMEIERKARKNNHNLSGANVSAMNVSALDLSINVGNGGEQFRVQGVNSASSEPTDAESVDLGRTYFITATALQKILFRELQDLSAKILQEQSILSSARMEKGESAAANGSTHSSQKSPKTKSKPSWRFKHGELKKGEATPKAKQLRGLDSEDQLQRMLPPLFSQLPAIDWEGDDHEGATKSASDEGKGKQIVVRNEEKKLKMKEKREERRKNKMARKFKLQGKRGQKNARTRGEQKQITNGESGDTVSSDIQPRISDAASPALASGEQASSVMQIDVENNPVKQRLALLRNQQKKEVVTTISSHYSNIATTNTVTTCSSSSAGAGPANKYVDRLKRVMEQRKVEALAIASNQESPSPSVGESEDGDHDNVNDVSVLAAGMPSQFTTIHAAANTANRFRQLRSTRHFRSSRQYKFRFIQESHLLEIRKRKQREERRERRREERAKRREEKKKEKAQQRERDLQRARDEIRIQRLRAQQLAYLQRANFETIVQAHAIELCARNLRLRSQGLHGEQSLVTSGNRKEGEEDNGQNGTKVSLRQASLAELAYFPKRTVLATAPPPAPSVNSQQEQPTNNPPNNPVMSMAAAEKITKVDDCQLFQFGFGWDFFSREEQNRSERQESPNSIPNEKNTPAQLNSVSEDFFTSEDLEAYSRIWEFVLHIKVTKKKLLEQTVLDRRFFFPEVYFRKKKSECTHGDSDDDGKHNNSNILPPHANVHGFQTLRAQLLHFVINLEAYVCTRLAKATASFEDGLSRLLEEGSANLGAKIGGSIGNGISKNRGVGRNRLNLLSETKFLHKAFLRECLGVCLVERNNSRIFADLSRLLSLARRGFANLEVCYCENHKVQADVKKKEAHDVKIATKLREYRREFDMSLVYLLKILKFQTSRRQGSLGPSLGGGSSASNFGNSANNSYGMSNGMIGGRGGSRHFVPHQDNLALDLFERLNGSGFYVTEGAMAGN